MGDKVRAKEVAIKAQVPVVPGISNVKSVDEIKKWMKEDSVAFPIMIKAASGGGGKGMMKVDNADGLKIALSQARSEAEKSFGDATLLAEKFIEHGRHIEVQIVGDTHGNLIHLYERECTLQRRNQKIIEEAPSPSIDSGLRLELCAMALRLMREINYTSAGTVEFIFDPAERRFYFLEVNTRLQVEHGVTELVTGIDIVSLMIDVAMGRELAITQEAVFPNRWAIEARLNAEDPINFNPSFGKITRLQVPFGPAVRIANGVYEGAEIPPYYDSLFMLLMAAGPDRESAIQVLDRTLSRSLRVEGIKSLKPLLKAIVRHPDFIAGEFSTHFIEEHMDDLIAMFPEQTPPEEAMKIARYVAEVSALGPKEWV
jgi:acetyl-CoA carboxylase biotin carboxylase subunit/propionyl-CoA carboxylase alpha chain